MSSPFRAVVALLKQNRGKLGTIFLRQPEQLVCQGVDGVQFYVFWNVGASSGASAGRRRRNCLIGLRIGQATV